MARPLLLSCEAVSKAYGTRSLFDGLTFGLFEGDQAGLVGPNGSGKSTLLRDVEGILWLEDLLTERSRAFLVVSHDRYFLEHVATRMLELNRVYPDGLFEAEGRYSEFLARRDEFLRGQAAYQDALANTVRREIEWLRRGAKARSTKAKGRIKQAGRLIEELQDARARGLAATAGIDFTSSQRRTRRLLVTRGVTKSLGGRRLVSDLDLVVTPGTRVGLIGPNGSGKTTLLNVLAGMVPPDAGE